MDRPSNHAISRRTLLRGVTVGVVTGALTQGVAYGAASKLRKGEMEMGTGSLQTDDGVRLSYQIHGSGPVTLLFMHGWAGSSTYYDETLRYLTLDGLQAVTFDFRGHGSSEQPEEGYTLDRYARDILAVTDAVGADRCVLVGYSMSARFAQYVALLNPQRVSGQVLIAGWPSGEVPLPEELIQDWAGRAGDRERLLELERQFITRPISEEVLGRWADDAVKVPQSVLEATLRMTVEGSFADRVATLETPTVAVGGLHDPVATPDFMRQGVVGPLSATGGRLVILDCNHDVPIEQPRELAAVIEAFVAGLPEASA